ncbi:Histone-lysine N-methyltransferase set9 [Apophysomyces sp. BC1021]|nr:Histone-lysine N-methyltransferase set9 [Apophysomyces sp. BC1021]
MNSGPREASLVPCEDVLDILRKDVTDAQNVSTASKKFVALEPVKKFMAAYSTAQQHKFEKYVRRYLSMYLPTAGYEICDTDRYGGNSQARLVATKDWDVGDEIRCCTGYIAYLDSEDDAQLRNQGRDFSVMYSYRKKKNCLFLGPARFANHDCDANCKFINVGNNGICFKVIKRVARGEELTVFYSNEYFGKDNCECRCVTCERKASNFKV